MKPNRTLLAFLGSRLGIITVFILGSAGTSHAQTWTNTTTGTSNWSTGTNWDTTVAPVSGTTTAVQFFATPGTVIPAASAIVASQDIATPMILNSLVVNGTGPGSGTAPSLTISGGAIQFGGTSPALNVNAGFGSVGYTVNLNSNLDFSADTAINYSGGGGFINVGSSVTFAGAGKVTFTGGLTGRPLSLTAVGSFTGDLVLSGSTSVLQLNRNTNILGPNTATTQSVTVASGSGVNLAYGDGAFNHAQNFVISGSGNASTSSAAINATRLNFNNASIGGLALAADSTVRIAAEVASEARFLTISRGLVGTGKLTKTGNGYLQPSVTSPASVTWGGTAYSSFTGNVEVKEGVLQTPSNVNNSLGSNAGTIQRVTVSPGAAVNIGAGNNASTQPQNFILSGTGTGYAANNGGFAALDSFGAGFGNNTVRRIVVATDSTVSARRDVSSTGLGRGLITQVGLSGTGNLTINGPYGAAISPVYLGQAASAFEEFPAFSGKVVINNGILNIGNVDALGASPAGQVTLSSLGALSSSLAGGLDQTFLSRIENLSTTGGSVCLGNASANNLDFTTAPNLRLGAINSFTYSGTLTPAGGIYRLGGGGGTLTVSSQLTGSASVVISGSVVLSNATNNFNGGVTIASNNTGLGQTASLGFTGGAGNLNGNAITFGGAGGALAYTGAAAGSSDSLGALSFPTGHSNVTSTKGAAGNTFLTFSSLAARSAGATGNFTVSGGTNGTDNKITVTGLASGFVDKGIFFGGANYAFNDATGFLRAPVYGTDAGFVTSAAAASVASATHQQVTGALSAQNSESFTTLKIAGAFGITLASSQSLTVGGILKTGATATISGGNGIQASLNSEMIVRSDVAADALTIGTPILANGTSSLTKTGAGTLTLTSVNTYTGATTVVAGTLTVGGAGGLEDNSVVTVNGGTYSTNSSTDVVGTVTLKNGVIGGTGIHQGSAYAVENGMVTGRLGGAGALTKSTAGQVILAAANSYSGGTTISGGTLTVSRTGSLDNFSSVTIENGATYELGGSDTVGDITLVAGSIRGPGALNGSNYDVRSGSISAPLAGTGTLTKSTAGTVTLAGLNTLVGEVSVDAGTLVLADNARLNFAISGTSTANSISGAGTATFDGDFAIDLVSGSPDLTTGNEWLLVNPTLTESYGASFSVVGFTVKPDGVTWTRTVGANQWTFSETSGKLSVGPAGYAAWADANNVTESENGDDDNDGVINLVEYALGLDPQVSTVPAGTFVGNLLSFTKGPEAKAAGDVTYIIETSTSLDTGSWAPAAATETTDAISFSLPPNQPGGKLFARLRVTKL
jgi:autotransporter-associated beta strand protein